ncbi:lytic transglycosylase domain-containing protein [Cupriavidus gilardii]|nr:lytic transglycosylase domain-containing protein [Cupriavidus gilardii]
MMKGKVLFFVALLWFSTAWADCWERVAAKYGQPVELLKVIAEQESSFNNMAVNANADGTRDVCMMQINSRWFPRLWREFRISELDLRNSACTCLDVGAWILSDNINRLGPTWEAIGAYNAASPEKRRAYAWKIYRRLEKKRTAAHTIGN